MRGHTSTLSQRPFDAEQSADFPAALQIKDEHRYTEHALRVFDGKHANLTVCGKRTHAGNWIVANDGDEFKYVVGFTEARSHTVTIPQTGEQHTFDYPTYISPLACKTCVRLVLGYVACPDCIPDYSATPSVRETWIKTRTRGARCDKHAAEHAATLNKGIQHSDAHGIVVHQENRREHVKHVIHITTEPPGYSTRARFARVACGRRMHELGQYVNTKYGLIGEVKPYSTITLRRARRNGAHVCPQCETYMRKRGYAVA
jgi:hypothetical protein